MGNTSTKLDIAIEALDFYARNSIFDNAYLSKKKIEAMPSEICRTCKNYDGS